jgi:hypothetical protein
MLFVAIMMLAVFSIAASADSAKVLINPDLTTINPALMLTTEEALEWYEFKAFVGDAGSGSHGWRAYIKFLRNKFIEYGAVGFIEGNWINEVVIVADTPRTGYMSNPSSTNDMPTVVLSAPWNSTQGILAVEAWQGKAAVSDLPWDATAGGLLQRIGLIDNPAVFFDAGNSAAANHPVQSGQATAISAYIPENAYNTICFLPGRYFGTDQDEHIVLYTHADSMDLIPDNCALGILGVVKYFSQIPQDERPRTLLLYIDSQYYLSSDEQPWYMQYLINIYPELQANPFVQITYEHMELVEADFFVSQVAAITQIICKLMNLDDLVAVGLVQVNIQDAIRSLSAGSDITPEAKSALLSQCDLIFNDAIDSDLDGALSKLLILKASVQSLAADGMAKTSVLSTIDNIAALIEAVVNIPVNDGTALVEDANALSAINVNDVDNQNPTTDGFDLNPAADELNLVDDVFELNLVAGGLYASGSYFPGRESSEPINLEDAATGFSHKIIDLLYDRGQDYLATIDENLVQALSDEEGAAAETVFIDEIAVNAIAQTADGDFDGNCDFGREDALDQLDLSTALMYYMAVEGDINWQIAQRADINNDGCVDIEDLILIHKNIVW